MTMTYRDTKGSKLTMAEVDENFRDLDARVSAGGGSGGDVTQSEFDTAIAGLQTQIDNAAITYDPVTLTGAGPHLLTAAAHANRLLICNHTGAMTLTLQTDAAGGFAKDDSINAVQYGIGAVTIVAGGATLRAPQGSLASTTAQYRLAGAVRVGANEWTLSELGGSASSGNSATPEARALTHKRSLVPEGYIQSGFMSDGIRLSNTAQPDGSTLHGNIYSMYRSMLVRTAAAAVNRVAGVFNNASVTQRNVLAPTWGGWPMTVMAGIGDSNPTLGAAFMGIAENSQLVLTTNEPSSLVNMIGVGCDSGDANWHIMHNDGSGVATKIDMGSSFVRQQNAPLCVTFTKNATGTGIFVKVVNINTNATFTSSEITTNISNGAAEETLHSYRATRGSAFSGELQFMGYFFGGE